MAFAACSRSAWAEESILAALPLDDLRAYAASRNVDIAQMLRALFSGEAGALWDSVPGIVRSALEPMRKEAALMGASLCVPLLTDWGVRLLLGGGEGCGVLSFVCRTGIVAVLADTFIRCCTMAQTLMTDLSACTDVLSPVLIGASALAGAEGTAAMLTPVSALCAKLLQNIVGGWGIALCCASAVIAIAGNLSEGIRLNRLQAFLRKTVHWGTGACLAAFIGMLSVNGRLASGRDTVASRSAHYAVENIIPVIGGNVSDSLESLLISARVVRNAVGASGMALLLSAALTPLLIIGLRLFLLRFLCAIAEPLGDSRTMAMMEQTADATELLVVLSVAALVLCAMLAGSCLSSIGGILS